MTQNLSKLTDEQFQAALIQCIVPNHWQLSNDILYKLCKDHPKHTATKEVVAKVLMIGRVYAAALERIKVKPQHRGDDFYLNAIAPLFKSSDLDQKLQALEDQTLDNPGMFETTLTIHADLVKLIGGLEREDKYLRKRSFASKYLHFHHPELFFIYDSRAKNAMTQFNISVSPASKELIKASKFDSEYVKFADLSKQLKEKLNALGHQLTNRQLDNLLIEIANDRIRQNQKATDTQEPVQPSIH